MTRGFCLCCLLLLLLLLFFFFFFCCCCPLRCTRATTTITTIRTNPYSNNKITFTTKVGSGSSSRERERERRDSPLPFVCFLFLFSVVFFMKSYIIVLVARSAAALSTQSVCPVTDCLLKYSLRQFKYLYELPERKVWPSLDNSSDMQMQAKS